MIVVLQEIEWWDFPGGPVVKIHLPIQGSGVLSLVVKWRSHKPWGNQALVPQVKSNAAK